MAYGDLAERSFMSQMQGITSHNQFDGVVQCLIACLGDDVSLAKGAEQKSTRPSLTVARAKPSTAVCSEGVGLHFVEFLKAEPFGRKPFVQLNHDPNDPLTRIPGVPSLHELPGEAIQVHAEWAATAPTEEFKI
jgi:hypothetical protein